MRSHSQPPVAALRKNVCAATLAASALLACSASPPPAAAPTSATTPLAEPRHPDPTPPPATPAASAADVSGAPSSPAPKGPADTRTAETIRRVLSANRSTVRACYDAALRENPGIEGDLVVSFLIDPYGIVRKAEVNWEESDIHVPELDTCAACAIEELRFPPSSRGLESRVNYPFNFNPPKKPPPEAAPVQRHR